MLAKYMRRKICLDTQIDTADISSLLTFSQSTERARESGRGGGGGGERERREREKSLLRGSSVNAGLPANMRLMN